MMNNKIRDSEFFRRFLMNNKIRVELRGYRPSRGGFASMSEQTETALGRLGWKYSRIYFSEDVWIAAEYAEKYISVYRNAGLDEKYISITPMQECPGHVRVSVSNRGFEEDKAQEQLVLSMWTAKKRMGGYRRILYSGIPLEDEEGALSCDITLPCIEVTLAEGYGRRTAWRIAEKFADAMGMTVDRRRTNSVY